MRAPWIAFLALLCLVLAPALLAADEPAAKPPEAEDAKPGEKAEPEQEAEKPAKPLPPSEEWEDMQFKVRSLPRQKQRPELLARSKAYLEQWKAGGQRATGVDLYHLGLFHRQVLQYDEALAAFRAVVIDEQAPEVTRDLAAVAESGLLRNSKVRKEADPALIASSRERLLAYAEAMSGDDRRGVRTSVRVNVAGLLDADDQKDASLDLMLRAVLDDPGAVTRTYRAVVRNLVARSHSMDGYPGVRAAAIAAMNVLKHQQRQAVKDAEARVEALEAEGNEKGRAVAERAVSMAHRYVERIDKAGRPFEMLGEPAPAWTLDHAFSGVEKIDDLKGKVVVLDFWATWCGWCIKSFPAIRDLLRDYGDQGLVVVGVTASSNSVYEHRYDLDDDFKSKAEATEGGYRPKAGARLANARNPADGKLYFEGDAFRAKEKDVLATFMKNHEMTWPVVMIDKTEPGPKYALTGWPHAVVLDRQGRVRYFKSGALLRDRPQAVAAFRKVLEDLLAEPGGE